MSSNPEYRLGRLPFTLIGDNAIAPHVRAELEVLRTTFPVPRAPLEFVFVDRLPEVAGGIRVSPVVAGDGAYSVQFGGLAHRVTADDRARTVHVQAASRSGLARLAPAPYARFRHWNYLLHEEDLAKNFVYNVFDYLTQIEGLRLGQSYVHASAIARDGAAAVLAAWGGVGKTSAMLNLVRDHGWSYLADDLVAVDDAGTVYRSPKRIQVYAYNLEGQAPLADALMHGRTRLDRLAWTLHRARNGPKGVRRRVAPDALFPASRVAATGSIADVLLLERCDVASLAIEPMDVEVVADRCAVTLLHELQPYTEIAFALAAAGTPAALPIPTELAAASRAVLQRAFSAARVRCVRIPLRTSPGDLTHFLARALDT